MVKRDSLLQEIESLNSEAGRDSYFISKLEQGNLLGNHLVDALALGLVVTHGLYTPRFAEEASTRLEAIRRRIGNRIRKAVSSTPAQRVAVLTVAESTEETQRLIFAEVTGNKLTAIARRDIQPDLVVGQGTDQALIDYEVSELVSEVRSNEEFYADIILIDPRLKDQMKIVRILGGETKMLITEGLGEEIKSTSPEKQAQIMGWLADGEKTLDGHQGLSRLLSIRLESYGERMSVAQASVVVMLELACAIALASDIDEVMKERR